MYQVVLVGDGVAETIDALPGRQRAEFADLRARLERAPWTIGRPLVRSNPAGLRSATIGPDGSVHVTFGIIDRDLKVSILQIVYV